MPVARDQLEATEKPWEVVEAGVVLVLVLVLV
jgi:hypothetical protein